MVEKMIVRKPSGNERSQALVWSTWSKEVSEFPWEYSEKETCLVIAGSATVVSEDGSDEVSFSEGDYVIFPAGLKCTWKINEEIKKHYKFGDL